MDEPLYPQLTLNQQKILQVVKSATRITHQQIAAMLSLEQRVALLEISSLINRAALVAVDTDFVSLGKEAGFWMSPDATKGICGNICPSCGINPCSKPSKHGGMCYCSDCRHDV